MNCSLRTDHKRGAQYRALRNAHWENWSPLCGQKWNSVAYCGRCAPDPKGSLLHLRPQFLCVIGKVTVCIFPTACFIVCVRTHGNGKGDGQVRQSCSRRTAVMLRRGRKRGKCGLSLHKLFLGTLITGVVVVAVLFPQELQLLSETLFRVMGGEVEFAEVFAAFGRAAGGEETLKDSLQDAYTAVFNPGTSNADTEKSGDDAADSSSASSGQKIAEVWTQPSIPDNASLEQRNLDFAVKRLPE